MIGRLLRLFTDRGAAGRLARGWSSALFVNVLAALSAFGLHFLLTNIFTSAERYGTYVYVIAWVRVLLLFAKLGLDRAALKFVATYQGQESWALLRGFLVHSHRTVAVCATGLAILMAAAVSIFGLGGEPLVTAALLMGCPLLVPQALIELHVSCLRALGTVARAMAPRDVLKPALIGLLALLVWLAGRELTPNLALLLTLVSGLAVLATTSLFMRRAVPAEIHGVASELDTRLWTRTAFSLLLVTGFNVLGRQVDAVMLGAMIGPEAVGLYNIPSKIVSLIGAGLGALNVFLAPDIARCHAQDRRQELQQSVTLASRIIFVFTLATSLGVLVGHRWILGLFGDEFLTSANVLFVLTASQVVNALAGSVGLLMTMTGHERQAARIVGTSVVLSIVFNLILIPPYGPLGAAIGTLISVALWNLTMVVYVRQRVGINPVLH